MTSVRFQPIEKVASIKKVIKNLFDTDLDVSGGWGYDENTATIVESLGDMPVEQFSHTFASIRANIEMNATLDKDDRYGGINLSIKSKKTFNTDNQTYEIFTFLITAMKEKEYASFIKEYKECYGKKEFDLADHFYRRKESTIEREVDFCFKIQDKKA